MERDSLAESERAALNGVDVWYLCDLIEELQLVRQTMPTKIQEIWVDLTLTYCTTKEEDTSREGLEFMEKILRKKWKNEKLVGKQ